MRSPERWSVTRDVVFVIHGSDARLVGYVFGRKDALRIQAVPDFIDALRQLIIECGGTNDEEHSEGVAKARAALKKARIRVP